MSGTSALHTLHFKFISGKKKKKLPLILDKYDHKRLGYLKFG